MVRAPAHRAGDPGSNPGPDENFSLILLILRTFYNFFKNKNEFLKCIFKCSKSVFLNKVIIQGRKQTLCLYLNIILY